MTNINKIKIMIALALVHDDLTTIHSDLTAIRSDLDKIAADTGYQAGVIRAAEGSVKALANRLKEVMGFPPAATVAAVAPGVTGEVSSLPLTPEQVHDLATAIANAVTGTPVEKRKTALATPGVGAPIEDIPKPALVTSQPLESPAVVRMKGRIRDLERRGLNKYDIALQLMREHYPMREIVRHLHVSPRRIAKLKKGEEKK